MKKRWKILIGASGAALAGLLSPVIYTEAACGPDEAQPFTQPFTSALPKSDHRPEARSWLTYPEWHIVHAADSYGRHLAAGRPPSSYDYWGDVGGFWRSTCAVNKLTAGRDGASDTKIMIYTIGVSFTAEMAVKWLWEETIGHLFEALDGHDSANDRHATKVQVDYGAFMHQVPWYDFPFGQAFKDTWRYAAGRDPVRHWERRIAMSMEYGVKAIYAQLIGFASGETLGADQLRLKFTTSAPPEAIAALDPRLKPVGKTAAGLTIVDAPRYAEFSDLLVKMADAGIAQHEIAGNDQIFLTILAPEGLMAADEPTLWMDLGDRPGWQRIGMTVEVSQLSPTLRDLNSKGAEIEHVHDY